MSLPRRFAYPLGAAGFQITDRIVVAIGNSGDRALGVQLVGPIAGAFCLASACVYTRYPERRVLAERVALERENTRLDSLWGTGSGRAST